MKIALIIERMDVARGGREASTAQVASALAARGHEVTILCQDGSPPSPGIGLEKLGASKGGKLARLRSFIEATSRHLVGGRYDITHAVLPVPGAMIYQPRGSVVPAQMAASLRRRGILGRVLCQWAAPWRLRQAYLAQLERQVVADPRVTVLAVSTLVAEEVRTYLRRSDGVRVIFNAVDVSPPDMPQRAAWRKDLRRQLGVDEAAMVFLTLGGNARLKGIDRAVEAFEKWAALPSSPVDAHLMVVGLPARKRPRARGRRVHFFDRAADVFPYYAACDAVILLSWQDACSRVVLEATAWGIPSLTTEFNGAAEVLSDGAGIVIPRPSDYDAIAAALGSLSDGPTRAALAGRCRDKAAFLGMGRHVDELELLYKELTAR